MDPKKTNLIPATAGAGAPADHVPTEAEGFDHGEPNSAMIGIVGGAIVLVVVVVILAITYLYDFAHDSQVDQVVGRPVWTELLDLRAHEDADLYQYKYIDRNTGAVRLPIDRAEELLIKEAAEGKLKYPTAPAPVKSATELAAAPGGAPGAAPNTNATPAAK